MDLQDIRKEIDSIDQALIELFCKRMELSGQVASYKAENNLPLYIPDREREILCSVAQMAGPDFSDYTSVLYSMLFGLSRSYQSKIIGRLSSLNHQITDSIAQTPKKFPGNPMIACLDVDGSYSQIAAEKISTAPSILYFESLESVFQSIEEGICQYGILPIENSTAGSVNKVNDLMIRHNFFIVRTFRLNIDHTLLVKPGTSLENIRKIYSHEPATHQCGSLLQELKGVSLIPVSNASVAAQMVAESPSKDVAAISSTSDAELYSLEVLNAHIPGNSNLHTNFICISKNMEIYPGADKTRIMMILNHKPGALYKVLALIYTLGMNIIKLESRPLPDRASEFMFYFDLETSVYSDEFAQLICELDDLCKEFKYLGSYSEVVL